MPPYLTDIRIWNIFWPLPVAAFLISFAFYWVGRTAEERKGLLIILTAFSILGIGTGYLAGLSREPVAGEVLPAVLSLFAGLAVFLVAKDKVNRVIVGLSIFAFAVCLLIGSLWGSRMRWEAEQYLLSETYLKYRADVEAAVAQHRKTLGLAESQK